MQQEIKYGTFSAVPDDYLAPDGDIAAMAGLERKGGALWGELPGSEVTTIPTGHRLMCIHKTSLGDWYILLTASSPHSLKWWDGETEPSTIASLLPGVSHVEPVGNTLVAIMEDGLHYFLWNGNGYTNLGRKMPEVDISFSLKAGSVSGESTDMENNPWLDYIENNTPLTDELKNTFNTMLHGLLNKLTAEDVTGRGKFSEPFFVRYALRLYDGSLAMHSGPVLMLPSNTTAQVNWAQGNVVNKIFATVGADTLEYESHAVAGVTMWKDIVTSVDIFISAPLYVNDQAKDFDRIKNPAYRIKGIRGSETEYSPTSYSVEQLNNMCVPQKSLNKWQQSVKDCSTFYLLKSIPLEEFAASHARAAVEIEDDYLQSLVAREAMVDDYHSHDVLRAKSAYSYNGRLNLSNIIRETWNGQNPFSAFCYTDNETAGQVSIRVEIVRDGKTIVVERKSKTEYNSAALQLGYDKDALVYYYYPDSNAKKAYVKLLNQWYVMPMQSHMGLNGAFFFNLEGPSTIAAADVPEPSADKDVALPNKVYTSEVDNPFFFPAKGINTVGNGEVLGICSAVKAMSQGQFGQFPLYAFTDEGVWALQTNSEGGYSAVQPVTRDVCVDADSITQMDDAVLFATARGIMLISGSTSQCISEVLDGRVGFSLGMMTEKANALKLLADASVRPALEMATFERFMEGMRMLYDYRHQRVIVYNDSTQGGNKVYPYAYVYSLESHKWSIVVNDLIYHTKSYPDAIAVTSGGKVVNMSADEEPQGRIPFVLVTRPMDLGAPDIHKTVQAVIQRGVIDKSHVQQVLFGSRDLLHWHLVSSSTDAYLRGYRGTEYKWFRLMVLGALEKGESLTGATVQYETRLMNKPR